MALVGFGLQGATAADNCAWTREQYDGYVATCAKEDGCRLRADLERILKEECGATRPAPPGAPTARPQAPAPPPPQRPTSDRDDRAKGCASARRFVQNDLGQVVKQAASRYNAFRDSREFVRQLRDELARDAQGADAAEMIGLAAHMTRTHANLVGNLLCVDPATGKLACSLNRKSQRIQEKILDGTSGTRATEDRIREKTQTTIEKSVPILGPIIVAMTRYAQDLERTTSFVSDFREATRGLQANIDQLDRQLARFEAELEAELSKADFAQQLGKKLLQGCADDNPVPLSPLP